MLLFRLPYASYENRPLELHLEATTPPREALIKLDL